MSWKSETDQIAKQRILATQMGGTEAIAKQHERGRLTIRERIETLVDGLVSVGAYVLTGGELPALVVVEAVARLIPGVLGNPASALDESFSQGLLEYPQYTRPRVWRDQEVPTVLLSGHHQAIDAWRREQALARTSRVRPDLLAGDLLLAALGPRREKGEDEDG